jgi:hypothetical protein
MGANLNHLLNTYTVVNVEEEHGLFIVFGHFIVGVDVNEKS